MMGEVKTQNINIAIEAVVMVLGERGVDILEASHGEISEAFDHMLRSLPTDHPLNQYFGGSNRTVPMFWYGVRVRRANRLIAYVINKKVKRKNDG